MNPHQQEIIRNKMQKDTMFMQAYMQDVNNCRTLRTQALQAAMGMRSKPKEDSEGVIDGIISDAQKIYDFYTQDGKFEDLSQEPAVKLVQ